MIFSDAFTVFVVPIFDVSVPHFVCAVEPTECVVEPVIALDTIPGLEFGIVFPTGLYPKNLLCSLREFHLLKGWMQFRFIYHFLQCLWFWKEKEEQHNLYCCPLVGLLYNDNSLMNSIVCLLCSARMAIIIGVAILYRRAAILLITCLFPDPIQHNGCDL